MLVNTLVHSTRSPQLGQTSHIIRNQNMSTTALKVNKKLNAKAHLDFVLKLGHMLHMSHYINIHGKSFPRSKRKKSFYAFLLGSREDIGSLKSVRSAIGTKDLVLLALPLGLVDGIDPVLDFHDDAAVLGDKTAAALGALGRLDGKST